MESFESPKQLIVDHYDEVKQQVVIFVEGLLEKCHDFETDLWRDEDFNDVSEDRFRTITRILFPTEYDDSYDEFGEYENISGYKDPYKQEYDYEHDMSRVRSSDVVILGHIRTRGYLELFRSKAIDELKKAEEEALESYEINKHLYKYDRDSLTDVKVAEMRRSLFGEKFCFMLKINRNRENIFNQFLIISDFYLDENDLRLLKDRTLGQWHKKIRPTLNEKSLLVYLVNKYISDVLCLENYRIRIISIAKSTILGVERVKIGYPNIGNVYFPRSLSIDFSSIKSLTLGDEMQAFNENRLYKIRDLSGLINLEYLRINRMAISSDSFYGLQKLIRLSLNSCRCSSEINFDSLVNLKILTLKELDFPVELKCLGNLKLVEIIGPNDPNDLVNFSESINILELYGFDENDLDEFFARLNLPNLYRIKFGTIYTLCPFVLKEKWFDGIKSVKELFITCTDLSSLDFCYFGCFAQLEKLDVFDNQINILNQGVFSQLKRLKSLNLSKNHIPHLQSNVFQDLSNLEYLFLKETNGFQKSVRIEKGAFNGLKNLKELDLSYSLLGSIDTELFIHTPNLVKLSIGGNKIDIEYISANLKQFKEVLLYYSDIKDIPNEELNKRLKNSNIKIKSWLSR